jgi:hypothetical protein
MSDPIPDSPSLELAFRHGAVRVLRRRAEALRKRASDGVIALDCTPAVIVLESESAHALRIARDWDRIASELEAERGL